MSEAGASRLTQPVDSASSQATFPLLDVFQHTSFTEMVQRLPHIPCARSSLLFGMASGASVGMIQVVAGRGLGRAMNWTVGSFLFVSVFGWETCRRARSAEQAQMRGMMDEYTRRRDQRAPKAVPIDEVIGRRV